VSISESLIEGSYVFTATIGEASNADAFIFVSSTAPTGTNNTLPAGTMKSAPFSSSTVTIEFDITIPATYYVGVCLTTTSALTMNYAKLDRCLTGPDIKITGTLSPFVACTPPSATQTFTITGKNMEDDITVGPLTGYEFLQPNTTYGPTLLIPYNDQTGNAGATVTVRLAATAAGSYNGNIPVISDGADNKYIAVAGKVEQVGIVLNNATITGPGFKGFNYANGAGPSATQSFTVTRVCMNDAITVTLSNSTNFEVSKTTTFSGLGAVTLDPGETTVYIRMKSGLASGATYNSYSSDVTVSGGSITKPPFTVTGDVYTGRNLTITPAASTTVYWGATFSTGACGTSTGLTEPTKYDAVTICGNNTAGVVEVASTKLDAVCGSIATNNLGSNITLRVNGNLTVYGNVSLDLLPRAAGAIGGRHITVGSSGKLHVTGDFDISNMSTTSGSNRPITADATINGNVIVDGNFSANNANDLKYGGNNVLGSGTLVVGGNFAYYGCVGTFGTGNGTTVTTRVLSVLELSGCNKIITLNKPVYTNTFRQSGTCPSPKYAALGQNVYLCFNTYDQNCNPVCLAEGATAGNYQTGFTGAAAFATLCQTAGCTGRYKVPTNLSITIGIENDASTGVCATDTRKFIIILPASIPAGVTYQWYKDGIEITSATSSSYTTTAGDKGTYEVYWQLNGCSGKSTNSISLVTGNCGPNITTTNCNQTPVDVFKTAFTSDAAIGTFQISANTLGTADNILITPTITGGAGAFTEFDLYNGLTKLGTSGSGWLLPITTPGSLSTVTLTVKLNTTATPTYKEISFPATGFAPVSSGTPYGGVMIRNVCVNNTFTANVRHLAVDCTGALDLSTAVDNASSWETFNVICKNLASTASITVSISNTGVFELDYPGVETEVTTNTAGVSYTIDYPFSTDTYTFRIRTQALEEASADEHAGLSITGLSTVCDFYADITGDPGLKITCPVNTVFEAIAGGSSDPIYVKVSGLVDPLADPETDFEAFFGDIDGIKDGTNTGMFSFDFSGVTVNSTTGGVGGNLAITFTPSSGVTSLSGLYLFITDGGSLISEEECGFTAVVDPFSVTLEANATTYCDGQIITLTATAVTNNGETFEYTFSDGNGWTSATTVSNTTSYTVGYSAPAPGTITFSVTVNEVDNVPNSMSATSAELTKESSGNCPSVNWATYTTAQLTYCPGAAVSVAAVTSISNNPGSGITYTWTKGGGALPVNVIASGSSFSITSFKVEDIGDYKLVVSRNGVAIDNKTFTLDKEVAANTPPVPVITSADEVLCPGATATISVTSPAVTTGLKFEWYKDGATSPIATTTTPSAYSYSFVTTATFKAKAVYTACPDVKSDYSNEVEIEEDDAANCCNAGAVVTINFGTTTTATSLSDAVTECADCAHITVSGSTYSSAANTATGHSITTTPAGITSSIRGIAAGNGRCFIAFANNTTTNASPHTILTVASAGLNSKLETGGYYKLTYSATTLRNTAGGTNYLTVVCNTISSGEIDFGVQNANTTVDMTTSTYQRSMMLKGSDVATGGIAFRFYGNAFRSALDNIVLTRICPPDFDIKVIKTNPCNASTTLEITNDAGDIKNGDIVRWYKKNLNTGEEELFAGPSTYSSTTPGTYTLVITDPEEMKGNVQFGAKVTTNAGYTHPTITSDPGPSATKWTPIFTCQEVTITGNPSLCATGDKTQLTANIDPVIEAGTGIAYNYEWQTNPSGVWTKVAGSANSPTFLAPENAAGESYRVVVTAFKGATPTVSNNAVPVTVVPGSTLVWIGVGTSTDWNNSSNWKKTTDGTTPTGAGYVPRDCDDIYISAAGSLPSLKDRADCNTIHFLPDASIGGIHNLNITGGTAPAITVDLSLKQSRWYLLSPVLAGQTVGSFAPTTLPVIEITTPKQTRATTTYRNLVLNGVNVGWSTASVPASTTLSAAGAIASSSVLSLPFSPMSPNSPAELTALGLEEISITLTGSAFLHDENAPSYGGTVPVDFTGKITNYGSIDGEGPFGANYILVGNPYMSHLDLDKFHAANAGKITSNSKLHSGLAFSAVTGGETVAPLQSFLVQLQPAVVSGGGTTVDLAFDAAEMSVVDVATVLRNKAVKPGRLDLQASIEGTLSEKSFIIAEQDASNSYLFGEDALMLFTAESPIDIYTMAGRRACDVNRINADSLNELFIPVNIRTKKTGTLKIEIKGIKDFYAADNIYLFNKQTGVRVSLLEQDVFDIEKTTEDNIEDRLYLVFESLRSTGGGDETTSIAETGTKEAVFVYGSNNNIIVKTSEQLLSVTIYDVTGRTIQSATGLQGTSFTSSALPATSAYIVTVVTNQRVSTKKVFIK
jgi:hypothetical protein